MASEPAEGVAPVCTATAGGSVNSVTFGAPLLKRTGPSSDHDSSSAEDENAPPPRPPTGGWDDHPLRSPFSASSGGGFDGDESIGSSATPLLHPAGAQPGQRRFSGAAYLGTAMMKPPVTTTSSSVRRRSSGALANDGSAVAGALAGSSAGLRGFVGGMLRAAPGARLTIDELLAHPFLRQEPPLSDATDGDADAAFLAPLFALGVPLEA